MAFMATTKTWKQGRIGEFSNRVKYNIMNANKIVIFIISYKRLLNKKNIKKFKFFGYKAVKSEKNNTK